MGFGEIIIFYENLHKIKFLLSLKSRNVLSNPIIYNLVFTVGNTYSKFIILFYQHDVGTYLASY